MALAHIQERAANDSWWEDATFENFAGVLLKTDYVHGGHEYTVPPLHSLKISKCDSVTNARIKRYLRKDVLQVANDDIFASGENETSDGSRKRPYDVPRSGAGTDKERSLEESRRRAKSKVTDIALCNQFTHMFTWTLDCELIDRYDANQIYAKVRAFLSHMSQRKGFTYVLIPEYHKLREGEERPAIHMHGLCSLGSVRIVPARHKLTGELVETSTGRPIFNMIDWHYGYSTVVPLDEHYDSAVGYIAKYITKAPEKIFGKWYLSSRKIHKSPTIVPVERLDYNSFRDEQKLAAGVQYECPIYYDVKIITEEFYHGEKKT